MTEAGEHHGHALLVGGGDHLGVHRGGRTNQQRVGVGHRGQQFRTVGAVHPAHLDLIAKGGDGRLGEFVGDQHNGQAHADSVMGLN
mgnify:CR=1 FL=1